MSMKTALLSTIAGFTAFAANAADLPSMKGPAPAPVVASADGFDFAFGLKAMSDYISRGITQSDHQPSATVYFEPRYNIGDTQLYVGSQLWKTNLPTNPFGEVDLYGGIRQTWGKFTVDLGAIYYLFPDNKNQYFTGGTPAGYPGGPTLGALTLLNIPGNAATCNGFGPFAGLCATTAKDPSWLEFYLKPSYNFTDTFSVAANLFYSTDWNHYSQNGGGGFSSTYLSVLPKYTFGESGFSISGELGYQWLGTLRPGTVYNGTGAGFKFPSYLSWNAGVSYAWNNVTADLRYYGSDLNKSQCYVVSSDPSGNRLGFNYTGTSKWCDNRIMASLAVDFTYGKDFKK
jgi:hypothetical protein